SLAEGPGGIASERLFAVALPALPDQATDPAESGQSRTLFDLAIHPGGNDLVVLDGLGRMYRWGLADGGPPRLLQHTRDINFPALNFDPSGSALLYVNSRKEVARWDWQGEATTSVSAQRFTGASLVRLARTADGVRLAIAAPANRIIVYDLAKDRELL